MSIQSQLFRSALAFCLLGASVQVFSADSQWHFKVTNDTKTPIIKLEVSENKKDWGDFDIGKGIKPGVTDTMVWDASTDSEDCNQWIRAKFADGSTSDASKLDFCKDLDDPIVFSE